MTGPAGAIRSHRVGWFPACLLAVAWGLVPALPALLRGEILGHPYTDLYPSVWGMGWFVGQREVLPTFTSELCQPAGMGFYYSSPLHGWLALPLVPLLGLPATFNLLVVLARVATVILTWGWLRAEGLGTRGALAGAVVYGCAACFQGYAVEGIVEGTDAWTLPLWAWLVARRRPVAASAAFLLVVLSSWYLGLAGILVAVVRARQGWLPPVTAALGTLLAIPAWMAFSGAFPGTTPLDPAIRAAMGTPLRIPTPGILPGLNPFAQTSYVGWLTTLLVAIGARRHPLLVTGALAAWVLSLGTGPWFDLPGFSMIRFPYRLVSATLFLAAPVVGAVVDRWRFGHVMAVGILLETWLLAPVEPWIPGALQTVPSIYTEVDPGVLLDVPGPLARPPGVINRSRPRSRYLLYWRGQSPAASPWCPDFNGMNPPRESALLAPWRSLDPQETTSIEAFPRITDLRTIGVTQVMVHRDELGRERAERLDDAIQAAGARLRAADGVRTLYDLP